MEKSPPDGHDTFCPASREEWRQWLQAHHASRQSVWLICYRKDSGRPTVTWSDAVDEALCFGWIDSTRRSIDHESFMQYFGRRKAGSTWSKVNKAKVEQLIAEGRMMPAGLASIARAKKNGSWDILNEVEELLVPDDLEAAFGLQAGSKEFFDGQSRSVRKMMLHWVVTAKREETRQKRIHEIARLAGQGARPARFG